MGSKLFSPSSDSLTDTGDHLSILFCTAQQSTYLPRAKGQGFYSRLGLYCSLWLVSSPKHGNPQSNSMARLLLRWEWDSSDLNFQSYCALQRLHEARNTSEWHFVFKYSFTKCWNLSSAQMRTKERKGCYVSWQCVLPKSHLPNWLVFVECLLVTRIISNNTILLLLSDLDVR